jgi:hypothetical protein
VHSWIEEDVQALFELWICSAMTDKERPARAKRVEENMKVGE